LIVDIVSWVKRVGISMAFEMGRFVNVSHIEIAHKTTFDEKFLRFRAFYI
jgi:hypothetical protein